MGIYVIGDEGGYEGISEQYERFLGYVKDLTRDLRDSIKEIDRIKIREMETCSKLKGPRLDLLGAQSKQNIRDS